MNILSIETSCDETGVSILRTEGDFPNAKYEILGNVLFSQIDIHREYGGVFPSVAKREHAKTLVPMLEKALDSASPALAHDVPYELTKEKIERITEILYREPGLADAFFAYLEKEKRKRPLIDLIAVTSGPGLEPALWVGINFAKALALAWDVPIMPINHMEGHIFVSLFDGKKLAAVIFPALALLISGGHTELVLMERWNEYMLVGQTRDDAVGEAFDKVARMLGLPYPGGSQVSKLAEAARREGLKPSMTLPRPMLTADNYDFSFSGLKTAVLYFLKKYIGENAQTENESQKIPLDIQKEVALEFENAVAEVLIAKTQRAIDEHSVQTLILGGGVSANTHIRRAFTTLFFTEYPERTLYLPDPKLTTDNAVMIALAAHARASFGEKVDAVDIIADGNLSLHEK
jgi:N6-L-threonylcarbamoyladenine synthase